MNPIAVNPSVLAVSLLPVETPADSVHAHNLEMLIKRERHQLFFVNDEGKLALLDRWQDRLRYHSCFYHASMQEEVKEVISSTIKMIQERDGNQEKIEKLFFETLSPLSTRVFDRGEMTEDIEKLLSPSLGSLEEFAEKVRRVKLAVKLGVDFERVEEGFNGTYFGRDRSGKRLVVFKPKDEEGFSGQAFKWSAKIRNVFFTCFPKLKSHHNIRRDCADLNEAGASAIDRYLNLGVVPKTHLETFTSEQFCGEKTKQGSCQLFIEGAEMAIDKLDMPTFNCLHSLKHRARQLFLKYFRENRLKILEQEQLEKLAILDFLTGNQDGHLSNFLVTQDKKVVAIDQGLSFPSKPSGRWFSRANQYSWKHLNEAKISFSDEAKEWIKKLKNPEKLFKKLQVTMQDKDRNGFNEEQKAAMQQRIQVLCKVIEQKKSLAYLGGIQTKRQFAKALNRLESESLLQADSNPSLALTGAVAI